MKDNTLPELIGTIRFRDVDVNVYYHSNYEGSTAAAAWQMRNPDSCYQGIVYMNNETGMITYPPEAVIPEQTEQDREMLPKFVVAGMKELTEETMSSILTYFENEYKRRNKITDDKDQNI